MPATNFNTSKRDLSPIDANGLAYQIPPFQRDYSWTEQEWDDLWADLTAMLKPDGEPAHYLGYLVLQTHDDKNFSVIDGQQRLTTLSLMVLAAIRNLERVIESGEASEDNRRRVEQIRQAYIGFLDPVTLVSRSKLSLNRNNDNYYQTYLAPLEPTLPKRGIRASESLLRRAFEWLDRRIQLGIAAGPDRGRAIAEFVENMSDRLFFTVITVADELNAYKVFETLNARGVRLSSTDLLKNYLFSVLHRDGRHEIEAKRLEDRWENIVGRLGGESFPEFLRIHWTSRHGSVRQTELFKTIRRSVASREQAFNLLRDLEADLEIFLELTRPDTARSRTPLSDSLATLSLFNVTQPYPFLMAVKRRNLSERDWDDVVRACVVAVFRHHVIGGLSHSDNESIYHEAIRALNSTTPMRTGDVIRLLAGVYPTDEQFRSAFAEKAISMKSSPKKRLVRYILGRIEQHLSGASLEFDSDRYNIEHVLPENPADGWESIAEETVEAFAPRLGNLTLMESGTNREGGNQSYKSKRPLYLKSQFQMTRELGENYAEWTRESIEARQEWMAKQAVSIWRISQIS